MQKYLPTSKRVLQLIQESDKTNAKLKQLTRRRKQLIKEKVAIMHRFNADLQSCAPDLKLITSSVDNLWFLRFFTLKKDIRELARVHTSTILKIKHLGVKKLSLIKAWQKEARFNSDLDLIAPMLYEDAISNPIKNKAF